MVHVGELLPAGIETHERSTNSLPKFSQNISSVQLDVGLASSKTLISPHASQPLLSVNRTEYVPSEFNVNAALVSAAIGLANKQVFSAH